MINNKRNNRCLFLLVLTTTLLLIIASCGPADENAPDMNDEDPVEEDPLEDDPAEEEPEEEPIEEDNDPPEENDNNNEFGAEQQREGDAGQETKFKEKQYEQTPRLKGGPESTEREPNPVDNFELQKQFPNIVVLRGDLDDNRVALTFDDGPDEDITPQVLDVLDEYDVPATFFLIGERAKEHPDVVERMVDEGHVIANHSWDHPQFHELEDEEVRDQINRTEEVLADITGEAVRLFRPPYGAQNEDVVRTLGELNYSDVIWSQDSLDYQDLETEEVVDNILSDITYGAIVLQHSAGGDTDGGLIRTVEALHEVIPELRDDGMEFVTVDELLGINAYR